MSTAVHLVTREPIEAYLAAVHEKALAPAKVAKHYRSLQQLFGWLAEEGEIDPTG